MKTKQYIITILLVCLQSYVYGQICECGDGKVTICYTSTAEWCGPGSNCNYLLDGEFLQGARNKLNNASNYGPGGIINCELDLKPLVNIDSPQDITDLGCNIVFVGSISGWNNTQTTLVTDLPNSYLTDIREWSLECDENLTIVTQAEAIVWGYTTPNNNANPNVPVNNSENLSIFSGPFGTLDYFQQGGTFQGVFDQVPATGMTILAEDNFNQPTIVLDKATNDIVTGDIGIFCNGAGPVSTGPGIANTNDILLANLFALGCRIAQASTYSYQEIFLCPNDFYELPDGQIVGIEGEFLDTLKNSVECDSIILTQVSLVFPEESAEEYIGCHNDGYEITVNEIVYNELNPIGKDTLFTQYGCDSVVEIKLVYNKLDTSYINDILCAGETKIINGIEYVAPAETSINLVNEYFCDSMIVVNLESYPEQDLQYTDSITLKIGETFTFNNSLSTNATYTWFPSEGLSCADCLNPVIEGYNVGKYTLEVADEFGCVKSYDIDIDYFCDPYIPNIVSLSNTDPRNSEFKVQAPCLLNDFELRIYDRWGNKVHESIDTEESWIPSRGRDLNQGVYVYMINYSVFGDVRVLAGDVTIIE